MARLSASDASESSSLVIWPVLPSHRTTEVCLRLLAIDEGDASSLFEEAANLAVNM